MLFILVLLALALLFYHFLWKPQFYWRSINVKQRPAIPIMGDIFKMSLKQETFTEMVWNIYNRFKDARYCGLYQLTTPTLMLRDPDLIKQITVMDFDHFVDHRSWTTPEIDPLWSRMLFFKKGDNWKEMRTTMMPTFSSSKLRLMFLLMEKSAQQYVEFYLKENKNTIELELKDSFSRFANDVIASCAFGVQVDSLKKPQNEFYIQGREITDFTSFWKCAKFIFYMFAPENIKKFFKTSLLTSHNIEYFRSVVRDTIKQHADQNHVRPDMIKSFLEATKGRMWYEESTESHVEKTKQVRKEEMIETEVVAQGLGHFFAGVESISTTLSFMCYELAVNPDIQKRLRQEIDETYKENKSRLSYDVLNKMKYMEMVIRENMRKNATFAATDRVCTKPYTIQPERPDESPVHLKPGDIIWIPIYGLHHDEKYYSNPDKFDPERFFDKNKGNIKPYSYIPFGSGQRTCIGSRFALMEVKTLVFHILTKFELTVIEKTTIPIKFNRNSVINSIKGGFWVGMKHRENPAAL